MNFFFQKIFQSLSYPFLLIFFYNDSRTENYSLVITTNSFNYLLGTETGASQNLPFSYSFSNKLFAFSVLCFPLVMGLECFPVNLHAFLPCVCKVPQFYNDLHIPTSLQTYSQKHIMSRNLPYSSKTLPRFSISSWMGFILLNKPVFHNVSLHI